MAAKKSAPSAPSTSAADKVRAEYAEKLAAAEREDTIRNACPGTPRFVHAHKLYGSVASVSYTIETIADLPAIVDALPAESITLVRDGSVSFRPASYVDALPETAKARWTEETTASPIMLRIEALHGPKLSVEWYTTIAGVGLVSVKVECGAYLPAGVATYRAERKEFRGGYRYADARLTPANDLHSIHTADGAAVAQLESPIRWASGGPEYPQSFTLYFVDLGCDLAPPMVASAIARTLATLGTVQR